MIRDMLFEYFMSKHIDSNILMFLENYLFIMTNMTRQANIYN